MPTKQHQPERGKDRKKHATFCVARLAYPVTHKNNHKIHCSQWPSVFFGVPILPRVPHCCFSPVFFPSLLHIICYTAVYLAHSTDRVNLPKHADFCMLRLALPPPHEIRAENSLGSTIALYFWYVYCVLCAAVCSLCGEPFSRCLFVCSAARHA